MPIDVLLTEWDTIKERILLKYSDTEALCDVLHIDPEDLLDMFIDKVYNNLQDLDVTTQLDYEDDLRDV